MQCVKLFPSPLTMDICFKSNLCIQFFFTDLDMETHLLDSLTCPICFEIADNAVETSCCHQVYCHYCLSVVGNKPCPQCRQQFNMLVSHISRRIIGSMPMPCPIKGCNTKVMRSELKDHEMKCIHRLFTCPAPKCLFEGIRKEFAIHLATEHEHCLLKSAHEIFQESSGAVTTNQHEDRITTRTNALGVICRLGSTGKFYCGRSIDGGRYHSCYIHTVFKIPINCILFSTAKSLNKQFFIRTFKINYEKSNAISLRNF